MIAHNATLYPFSFRRLPERLDVATDMLAETDADVLCLQQIYEPNEIDLLTGKLEAAGYEVYTDYL